jgi:cell wall-associated NlpC family hydrolase
VLVLGLTLPSAATGVPRTARPTAGGVSPVRDRLAALTIREEKSVEQFDRTRITLAAARARLHAVDRRLHRARVELGAARHAMSQLAAAAYQGGGGLSGSELQLLLTTDPQTFVSSSSDLQAVSHRTASVLRRLERLTASLAAVRAQALHEERVAAAAARRLAADRARILATIAAERALQAQAGPSVTSAASPAYPPPAGSGPGAVAVRFAYRQLGKPYEWGAAGPDAYDCSGLTMAAWGAAGVSLPHSAADQQGMTTPVSASDLSPGDLIFFGSPAYHVGIYIGDGDMIDAPHTGTDVQINPISGYTSAGRP